MAARPVAPRPPAPPRLGTLVDRGLGPDDVTGDLLLSGARIRDAYAEHAAADYAEVAQVELVGGTLAGSQWHRPRWVDVRLDGVDLANAVVAEGGWERVAGHGLRATGLQLARARLTDLTLTDANLSLLNVRGATLRRLRLERCDLTDSQWAEATLEDVELIGCRLTGAEMSAVGTVTRVRLVECEIAGLSGLSRLRGATLKGIDPLAVAERLAVEAGLRLE